VVKTGKHTDVKSEFNTQRQSYFMIYNPEGVGGSDQTKPDAGSADHKQSYELINSS
jgi:hypothetical protein